MKLFNRCVRKVMTRQSRPGPLMASWDADQDLERVLALTGALQALEFLERSREIAEEPITIARRPPDPAV